MTSQGTDSELTKQLDTIQRHIWARINDEAQKEGIKLSIGNAYALGSVIKEELHPRVRELIATERKKAAIEELESLLPLTEIAKKPEHLGRVIRSHLSRYNKLIEGATLSQEGVQ